MSGRNVVKTHRPYRHAAPERVISHMRRARTGRVVQHEGSTAPPRRSRRGTQSCMGDQLEDHPVMAPHDGPRGVHIFDTDSMQGSAVIRSGPVVVSA